MTKEERKKSGLVQSDLIQNDQKDKMEQQTNAHELTYKKPKKVKINSRNIIIQNCKKFIFFYNTS